jgi:hypothetical protein
MNSHNLFGEQMVLFTIFVMPVQSGILNPFRRLFSLDRYPVHQYAEMPVTFASSLASHAESLSMAGPLMPQCVISRALLLCLTRLS